MFSSKCVVAIAVFSFLIATISSLRLPEEMMPTRYDDTIESLEAISNDNDDCSNERLAAGSLCSNLRATELRNSRILHSNQHDRFDYKSVRRNEENGRVLHTIQSSGRRNMNHIDSSNGWQLRRDTQDRFGHDNLPKNGDHSGRKTMDHLESSNGYQHGRLDYNSVPINEGNERVLHSKLGDHSGRNTMDHVGSSNGYLHGRLGYNSVPMNEGNERLLHSKLEDHSGRNTMDHVDSSNGYQHGRLGYNSVPMNEGNELVMHSNLDDYLRRKTMNPTGSYNGWQLRSNDNLGYDTLPNNEETERILHSTLGEHSGRKIIDPIDSSNGWQLKSNDFGTDSGTERYLHSNLHGGFGTGSRREGLLRAHSGYDHTRRNDRASSSGLLDSNERRMGTEEDEISWGGYLNDGNDSTMTKSIVRTDDQDGSRTTVMINKVGQDGIPRSILRERYQPAEEDSMEFQNHIFKSM